MTQCDTIVKYITDQAVQKIQLKTNWRRNGRTDATDCFLPRDAL